MHLCHLKASHVTQWYKLFLQCRSHKRLRLNPWVGKLPWRRTWQSTPVFLLENPMDRAAWWATVHRLAKSPRGLKQIGTCALSSKNSEYQRNYPKGLLKRNKFQTLSMVMFLETYFSPAMLLFVVCSKIRFSMLISLVFIIKSSTSFSVNANWDVNTYSLGTGLKQTNFTLTVER